jgi:hypothetical protein
LSPEPVPDVAQPLPLILDPVLETNILFALPMESIVALLQTVCPWEVVV